MSGDFFTEIGSALTSLYASNSAFFLAAGQAFLTAIVIIKLALIGLQAWGGALDGWTFIKQMGLILCTVAVMTWYASPMPWSGVTFPHLVIDEAKGLSDQLEGGSEALAQNKLNAAVANMEQTTSTGWIPSASSFLGVLYYFAIVILIGVEKIVIMVTLGISYLAVGVVTILGPLFIPWVLFPGLEHIAWNWLSSFLRYCLMQVVAAAVLFLNSFVLLGFFSSHPFPWMTKDMPQLFLEFLVVVVSGIWVCTWIPSIAGSILSGGGGESAYGSRSMAGVKGWSS